MGLNNMWVRLRNHEITRIVLILCALGTSALHAQVTGNISGYVRDPSGAAIPNATVTATMVEQQTARIARTDADGSYSTPVKLKPGDLFNSSTSCPRFSTCLDSRLRLWWKVRALRH